MAPNEKNPAPAAPAIKASDLDLVGKSDLPASLTVADLLKLLISTQQQYAEAQKQLADALLESRKPYVDPRVLAQKQQELEDRRRQIAIDQKIKANTKKICPHTRENGTSNIKWMQHSNSYVLGTCGTCFSPFDPQKDGADLALFRKDLKGMKNMGRAGAHATRGALIEA